ncbi:MAG: ATP synthase F1 subunit delta [Bacilli bacterium]|nr:ATP synthase F1 subunit delta [Bacilli bacterium]
MDHSLLKHYAQAYFSLGKEKNKVEVFHEDINLIYGVFQKNKEAAKFLSSPMVMKKDKDQLVDNAFKDKVDIASLGFLQVLIKKKAIAYFEEVYKHFEHLYHENQGILEGRVYTPFELSEDTLHKLEEVFSKKYQKKVVFRVLIDKKVIAGMKIYIDDTLYDYSIDNKLNQVRNKLIVQD